MNCVVCNEAVSVKRLKRFPHTNTCSPLCSTNKYRIRPTINSLSGQECEVCHENIPAGRLNRNANAKTCSPECSKKRATLLYRARNPQPTGMSTATIGAISELRVAVDLLQKGYAVFRALSSSCPCDLAILQDKKLFRLEVKTASRSVASGAVVVPKNKKDGLYDILAAVLPDEIVYTPCLPSP